MEVEDLVFNVIEQNRELSSQVQQALTYPI